MRKGFFASSIVLAFVLVTASAVSIVALAAADSPAFVREKKSLEELWEEYNEARSKDRPSAQLEILSQIKTIAFERHLPWDYYDAGKKYLAVAGSVNWKLRDSLKKAWNAEIEAFDEPIVSFELLETAAQMRQFADSCCERLRSARNEEFYTSGLSSIMGSEIAESLSSDYEYVLWAIMKKNYAHGHDALAGELAGSYPAGAYLEYFDAARTALAPTGDRYASRKAALSAVMERYSGRGIAFYPAQDLIAIKKDSLDTAGAGSQEYKALLDECDVFEKNLSALKGEEAGIAHSCTKVKSIVSELNSSSLDVFADSDTIRVVFRNLAYADFCMFEEDGEKMVIACRLENPAGSFYALDTLSYPLPKLDDGRYVLKVENGDLMAEGVYSSHTLSLATRLNGSGRGFYVCDFQSGEPLKKVDIQLLKKGRVVASVRDYSLTGGFSPLPSEISSQMGSVGGYSLQATFTGSDGRVRKSAALGVNAGATARKSSRSGRNYCSLFMDRSAYRSGDTAKVKAVLYSGNLSSGLAVFPEGEGVDFLLYDTQGQELESQKAQTNEFGSVSATFALPLESRGGKFSIKLKFGNTVLASKSFRVDEFRLPDYELIFDEIEDFYLPGDVVKVKGSVSSYSDLPLSCANLSYKLLSGNLLVEEGNLSLDGEGNFDLWVQTDKSKSRQNFLLDVIVSDGRGETWEYSKSFSVGSSLVVDISLDNADDARAAVAEGCPWAGKALVLGEDVARFTLTARNRAGQKAPLDLSWVLLDTHGEACAIGRQVSGEAFDVDVSSFPSGVYRLEVETSISRDEGTMEASSACNVLLIRPSDKVLSEKIEYLFQPGKEELEEGENLELRLGSGVAPLWAVAELYGEDSELLASRTIHLSGGGEDSAFNNSSLADLSFEYKSEYPQAVKLQLFYFRDGESKTYRKEFRRVRRGLDLPLEFSLFEDRTSPASHCTFGIKTNPGTELLAAVFDRSIDQIAVNNWTPVVLRNYGVPTVPVSSVCGQKGGENLTPILYLSRATSSSSMAIETTQDDLDGTAHDDETAVVSGVFSDDDSDEGTNASIRSDFSSVLAFEPFLRSDSEGNVSLSFDTSDKLGSYWVALFAHDKNMRNSVLRREMTVTLPVAISVSEPSYLYSGDKCSLAVSVSSGLSEEINGSLSFSCLSSGTSAKDSVSESVSLLIPAKGSAMAFFEIEAPKLEFKGVCDLDDWSINSEDAFGDLGIGQFMQGGPTGVLDVKLEFRACCGDETEFTDGIAFTIPVKPTSQTIFESHSAVLRPSSDRDSLETELRSDFTNVSAEGVLSREISLLELLREAIPDKMEPSSDNVLALSEAYLLNIMNEELCKIFKGRSSDSVMTFGDELEKVGTAFKGGSDFVSETADIGAASENVTLGREELLSRISACRNSDGGFGWFEGMDSSPLVTAAVLECFARIMAAERSSGSLWSEQLYDLSEIECLLSSAVEYLDRSQFCANRPLWHGGLSKEKYMHVRSMWASVPFEISGLESDGLAGLSAFKEYAAEYLTPSKDRGLSGDVFAKALRLSTLSNLLCSDGGLSLAVAWGVKTGRNRTFRKLRGSLRADTKSLLEYAVFREGGGMYFPNLKFSQRGLLEDEIYAHALICELFSDYAKEELALGVSKSDNMARQAAASADEIRLWLMLQNQTQNWGASPAFAQAIFSVLEGSDSLLNTKLLSLTSVESIPLESVTSSGNGISLSERTFYREISQPSILSSGDTAYVLDREKLEEGSALKKGEKVIAQCVLSSVDMRSFVILSLPHEAALRPVNQLSGPYGRGARKHCYVGSYRAVPQCYREVKLAQTCYYFDLLPDGDTVIEEEYFVVQEGEFSAPVCTAACLYAPEYSAVSSWQGMLESENAGL